MTSTINFCLVEFMLSLYVAWDTLLFISAFIYSGVIPEI